jgi:hypothetical protein
MLRLSRDPINIKDQKLRTNDCELRKFDTYINKTS